jgi:NB-ARC domain
MNNQEINVYNPANELSRGIPTNINNVTGDQYNYNYNYNLAFPQVEAGGSSSQAPSSPSFNNAPLDLLSVHFTGREKELARISEVLNIGVYEDIPTRCVVHGMQGLGKTQLALQFAKSSYNHGRYSLVFWISAATTDKLNNGFANILNLIRHPARLYLQDQSSKLTEARRWLEESTSISWLLVFDNVDVNTLDFIRENIPRHNRRGNILFTTRTAAVASALSSTAGQQYHVLELGFPDAGDAIKLLLRESGIDAVSVTRLTANKAYEVVKCVGGLPLAISQAACFMRQSHKELDHMLHLLQSERRIQVCATLYH